MSSWDAKLEKIGPALPRTSIVTASCNCSVFIQVVVCTNIETTAATFSLTSGYNKIVSYIMIMFVHSAASFSFSDPEVSKCNAHSTLSSNIISAPPDNHDFSSNSQVVLISILKYLEQKKGFKLHIHLFQNSGFIRDVSLPCVEEPGERVHLLFA
jgi:hypothetical protein